MTQLIAWCMLWPMSVRLSVCLSVCHKPILYRNDRTNRAGLSPILHCVLTKFRYFQNKCTSLWNCVLKFKLGTWQISPCMAVRRSSRNVVNLDRRHWTLSAVNWTVVGHSTKLTILATVDGCFLALVARLAIADTCSYTALK